MGGYDSINDAHGSSSNVRCDARRWPTWIFAAYYDSYCARHHDSNAHAADVGRKKRKSVSTDKADSTDSEVNRYSDWRHYKLYVRDFDAAWARNSEDDGRQ